MSFWTSELRGAIFSLANLYLGANPFYRFHIQIGTKKIQKIILALVFLRQRITNGSQEIVEIAISLSAKELKVDMFGNQKYQLQLSG